MHPFLYLTCKNIKFQIICSCQFEKSNSTTTFEKVQYPFNICLNSVIQHTWYLINISQHRGIKLGMRHVTTRAKIWPEESFVRLVFSLFLQVYTKQRVKCSTYCNDDKIKPTPCIGKVEFETKGKPFEKHFTKKDNGEDFVHVLESCHKPRSLWQVYILQGLKYINSINRGVFNNYFCKQWTFKLLKLVSMMP